MKLPRRSLRRVVRAVAILATCAGIVGCVHREAVVTSREVISDGTAAETAVRSGRNLPAAFVVVTPPPVSTDCPPQLRDPGMNSVLTLQNSVLQSVRDSLGTHYRAVGDYSVQPRGLYGDEQPGEGLRVDCARLRALGVVRLGGASHP